MTTSKKFSTIRKLPFCPESNPQTLYESGSPASSPLEVTNSSIDTLEKSLKFYWLLEKLVVTVTRSYANPPLDPQTSSSTTEIYFSKSVGGTVIEPYERVCQSFIKGNGLGYLISFVDNEETKLHTEVLLNSAPFEGITEDTLAFFGITSFNTDFGFTSSVSPFTVYVDTTIPIVFDDFTLYAKMVSGDPNISFDSITVDDYSFYEIV